MSCFHISNKIVNFANYDEYSSSREVSGRVPEQETRSHTEILERLPFGKSNTPNIGAFLIIHQNSESIRSRNSWPKLNSQKLSQGWLTYDDLLQLSVRERGNQKGKS